MNENESFNKLPTEVQYYFLKQITKCNKNLIKSNDFDKESLQFKEIYLKQDDTQFCFSYQMFKSKYFIESLQIFTDITIEILFPSKSFETILKQLSKIKAKSIQRIQICIFITSINSTIIQAQYNEFINQIIIDSSIQTIKPESFIEFKSLTQITIPSSVTSIGDFAFYECSSLTQITIPSSVTSIGNFAFSRCSSLNSFTIIPCKKKIIEYYDNQFLIYKSNPNSKIYDTLLWVNPTINAAIIPTFITKIANSSFLGCSSLTQITIPSSVTSIGNYAFYECSSLTQITIPSSVTSIGDYAFRGCSSLTQITIPSSFNPQFLGISSKVKITINSSKTFI